jgi:hypothetical protein
VYVVAAHETPSVVRVQLCIPVDIMLVHAPALQVGVVTVRDWVPEVSHVFAKPPHAPHAPIVTAPHELPSVTRVHACISVDIVVEHVPPLQWGVITVRVCVPVVAHASANPPQSLHAPSVTGPQSESIMQPTQFFIASLHISLQGDPGCTEHVVLAQTSAPLQKMPSSQGEVLALWTQPVAFAQLSSVQGFPSSQDFFAAP